MQIKMIHLNDPNALIEWSNTMDGVSKNINDYNPRRNRKILIICYDMIADVKCNKKPSHNRRTVYQVQKTQYFTRFYRTVLFFCSKICKIKFNILFDYENKEQNRIKKYCD